MLNSISSSLLVITMIISPIIMTKAVTIECEEDNACSPTPSDGESRHTILKCQPNETCNILCKGENSCSGNDDTNSAVIMLGGDATRLSVFCSGVNSCKGDKTFIHCLNTQDCELYCFGKGSCNGIQIAGEHDQFSCDATLGICPQTDDHDLTNPYCACI